VTQEDISALEMTPKGHIYKNDVQGKRFGSVRADNYPAHLAFSIRETADVSRSDNAAVSRSENAY